jgi:hypothetical protein
VTELSFFDAAGHRVSCTVEVEFDEPGGPAAHLHTRLLRVHAGTDTPILPGVQYLRQRMVAGKLPLSQSEPYDLLDNEIRIGLHLVRRFQSGPYPAELSQLVGYDVDVDEPFALFVPYEGEETVKVAGRLTLDQQREFQIGLARALWLLAESGVVHGRLGPDTVRWEDSSGRVQIVDFYRAVLSGEPRSQAGPSSWNPPIEPGEDQRATPADDMWSAGALTYYAVTGRQRDATSHVPGLGLRGPLPGLLEGVFAASPAARPSATQLLRRLRVPDPWLADDDGSPRFAAGQREFDQIMAMKRAAFAPPQAVAGPARPPGKPPRRRRRRWPLLTLLLVLIIFGVTVLAMEVS